jgi:hypothetical protein
MASKNLLGGGGAQRWRDGVENATNEVAFFPSCRLKPAGHSLYPVVFSDCDAIAVGHQLD